MIVHITPSQGTDLHSIPPCGLSSFYVTSWVKSYRPCQVVIGLIAGIGMTIALFISVEAFQVRLGHIVPI